MVEDYQKSTQHIISGNLVYELLIYDGWQKSQSVYPILTLTFAGGTDIAGAEIVGTSTSKPWAGRLRAKDAVLVPAQGLPGILQILPADNFFTDSQ